MWFLIALVGPFLFIIFWSGAYANQKEIAGWGKETMTSYYIMLSLVSVMLMSHSEDDVGRRDIRDGNLVSHLTKPFSYYWIMFFGEIPNRLFQGGCGIIFVVLIYAFFGKELSLAISWYSIVPIIFSFLFAYFISQTFKMIVGLFAFWFVDIGGFFQLVQAAIFILGGYLLPLVFMPSWLSSFAMMTPFPYMIYFPSLLLIEPVSTLGFLQIIGMQIFWIILLGFCYQFVWRFGVRRFTGIGN